jgi:hypothetical protein
VLENSILKGMHATEKRAGDCELTFSLIHFQMILVISSPSMSTTGCATLILEANALDVTLLNILFI